MDINCSTQISGSYKGEIKLLLPVISIFREVPILLGHVYILLAVLSFALPKDNWLFCL